MIMVYWDALTSRNILPFKKNISKLKSSINCIFKDLGPEIKISRSEISVPPPSRLSSIRHQLNPTKDEFLNVDALNDSTDMIIPSTKDHCLGPES